MKWMMQIFLPHGWVLLHSSLEFLNVQTLGFLSNEPYIMMEFFSLCNYLLCIDAIICLILQGVDYLKYDNCFNLGIKPEKRYN